MKKQSVLFLILNFITMSILSNSVHAIDPMREFMACVDELLEKEKNMDPRVAEDICSDILDGVKLQAPASGREGPTRASHSKRQVIKAEPGSNITSRDSQAPQINTLALLTEDIQAELSDPNFQIAFFTTSAAASYSLWWMLKNNPSALLKTVARRMNPAAAILPPQMTNEFFDSENSERILLPGSEEQLQSLKEWIDLSDSEKVQALQDDANFAIYLNSVLDSILAQKFKLINKNKIVF